MTTATRVHAGSVRELWDGAIIDADVHINASVAKLEPYLSLQWREFMRERGFKEPLWPQGLRRIYPPGSPSVAMPSWVPVDGREPASDLSLLREHVLDHLEVELAIANCYFAIDSVRHPDFAAALASAVNDWLIAEWLDRDPRLRASLVVPARSPEAAAKEIARVGDHPGFVQVLLPVRCDRLYGNRTWHPMIEEITKRDLVFGLHFGGTPDGPPTSTGWPSYYLAEYVGEVGVYWAQLTSLIAEGAFSKFPSLRVSVLEGGFAWLPGLSWRMAKDWKGLRRDVPWVKQPPTEIIREHMRFSTAPVDCEDPADLEAITRWLDTDELLMFATDYPHWHDDDLSVLLGPLNKDARRKLMADNARDWYRL
jgi:predicted TIM-barrel fold metal-dependent hydrolase